METNASELWGVEYKDGAVKEFRVDHRPTYLGPAWCVELPRGWQATKARGPREALEAVATMERWEVERLVPPASDSPVTYRVEFVDGSTRPVAACGGKAWLPERPGTYVYSDDAEREAVTMLAAHLRWPVQSILAPGQKTRAELAGGRG